GLELAQAFRRLGSRVTIVHDAPRVALREDEDVSAAIEAAFAGDGIAIRSGVRPVEVSGRSGEAVTLRLDDGSEVSGSHLLIATGRTPVTADLGLEA
ncbi:FAD-dependent oxidoreductase, partial [Burkholderia cenocepacia]|nr:FAD-dependent oxidoreductase [Burkholderia cenocepacia]